MIKIAELLSELEDFYIIVTIDASLLESHSTTTILNEGRWEHSGVGKYWQRIDPAHFEFQKKHIHIAQKKHVNSKGQQVSWNEDGTRHDAGSFNNNFIGMSQAKDIAMKALGLDDSVMLENENKSDGTILLESFQYNIPANLSVFMFHAKPLTGKQILK